MLVVGEVRRDGGGGTPVTGSIEGLGGGEKPKKAQGAQLGYFHWGGTLRNGKFQRTRPQGGARVPGDNYGSGFDNPGGDRRGDRGAGTLGSFSPGHKGRVGKSGQRGQGPVYFEGGPGEFIRGGKNKGD